MPWAKVDDQWFAHRKVVGLSMGARGLWTTVLSWSCAQRAPEIPEHMVIFLAGGDTEVMELACELVDVGLWVETDGGWRIHDWHEYQEKSLSEKRAEAGSKGGKARADKASEEASEANGRELEQANDKQTVVATEANGQAGTQPGPARPVPTTASPPSSGKQSRRKRRAPETPLPDGWEPTDSHTELATAEGVDLDREAAKFRDHAAANDRRQRDWNAAFSTWLRRAAEFGGGQARASPGGQVSEFAAGTTRW